MLRTGADLKQIADVLRHRSFETTMVYMKVDLDRLTEVAQPWPEEVRI
jgi:site-specific recombinase XerD